MFNFFKNLVDRYLNAIYAFFLCMALTLGATYFAYRSSKIENAGRFDRTVATLSNTLKNRMTVYINALVYTRNLFDIKKDLSRKEFSEFVSGMKLQENFPGIQSMGYVERLSRSQAKTRLAEMKTTFEKADISAEASEIDLVVYFEQLNQNTSVVFAKDMGSSPARKEAMNAARDLGVPIATDRVIPLLLPASTTYAFLVFMPRYKQGADVSTVENRRKALLGFVYAGFRAQNLFGRVSDDVRTQNNQLAMRIYDGLGVEADQIMYSEGDFDKIDPELVRTFEFKAANHSWMVEVGAPQNFSLNYLRWSPIITFLFGLMLSFAVMASLLKSDSLAARLKTAREEAEKANQAKSMFLANISHEIRTPLGVMIGFSEAALSEDKKEQRDSFLKTVLRNGHELGRIIGDVLDLSKIEAKTLLIEKNSFSLKKLNEDIKEMWQPQAEAKELQFSFEFHGPTPDYIESDETRIKQILTNLLSNALKFTSGGSVKISLEATASYLIYTIDDTGIGIRDESRAKLFKAFSQEDSSITRKFGGSGLGLAISKELAQALGGDITVTANPNSQGSRFVFKIPLVAAQVSAHVKTAVSDGEMILKDKKILLVEDAVDNQLLVEVILKKHGVIMSIANNGREGVDKALNNIYDLVLMDIQMPVLDGYAAFDELKKNKYQVPVIALTAHALKEEREKALKLGFAAYLTKPIDRVQLAKVCSQLIAQKKV